MRASRRNLIKLFSRAYLVASLSSLLGSLGAWRVARAQDLEQADSSAVDASTLSGKVLCGYQGWFNCEGDGAGLGWTHWARNQQRPFGPGNVTVDLWPDVSELSDQERYATEFRHADGRVAHVFSSFREETVLRHFSWMSEYGVDGVFLQRFANGLDQGPLQQHKDRVLQSVRRGCEVHRRAYAMMYDLSGLRPRQVERVWRDWQELSRVRQIHRDAGYLHHEGKPLVAVWGIGFNDGRRYGLDECRNLVQSLRSDGCAVMLGVPSWWREGRRDAVDDPRLQRIIEQADIVSPWSVGRYRTPEEAIQHGRDVWGPDHQWCKARNLAYLPVAFPGFSWHNLNGEPLDSIPRRKGKLFWSQVVAAGRCGCDMLYVAMFDEVDEGTAVFKCTSDPPVGRGVQFLDYENLPSDFYLRLVGLAGRMLRKEIPWSEEIPEIS